jgi:thiol-disulfide isomerase/thioredoxin
MKIRPLLSLCLFLSLAWPLVAVEPGTNISDLALPMRSGATTVKSYAGKVVLLDIWASWCGPCHKSLPFLADLQQRMADRGLVVVAISIDQDVAPLDAFLARQPLALAIGHDPEGLIPRRLAATAMPTSVLIDRTGVVRLVHGGFRSEDAAMLEAEVAKLLATETK